MGRLSKHLKTRICYHAEIFQAHAKFSWQIDTWFYCYNITCHQRFLIFRRKIRLFVNFTPYPMT